MMVLERREKATGTLNRAVLVGKEGAWSSEVFDDKEGTTASIWEQHPIKYFEVGGIIK
jgi:hypothetical protein